MIACDVCNKKLLRYFLPGLYFLNYISTGESTKPQKANKDASIGNEEKENIPELSSGNLTDPVILLNYNIYINSCFIIISNIYFVDFRYKYHFGQCANLVLGRQRGSNFLEWSLH